MQGVSEVPRLPSQALNFPSSLLNFPSSGIAGLHLDTKDSMEFCFPFSWYSLPFKPQVTIKGPFLPTTNACVPELLPGSSLPPRILMRTLWRGVSELLSLWTTGRISPIPPPQWERTLYTICQTSVRNAILWKWSWKIRSLLPPRAISAVRTAVFLRPATCMTETSAIQLWSHLGIMVRPKWCKRPWPLILATLTSLSHSPCSALSSEALHCTQKLYSLLVNLKRVLYFLVVQN